MENKARDPMNPVCCGWEVEGYPDHPEIAIDVENKPENGWEALLGCVVEMSREDGTSKKVQLVKYRWQEDAPWDGWDQVHAGMFFSYECGGGQSEPYHIVLGDDQVQDGFLILWAGVATDAVDAIVRMEEDIWEDAPDEPWELLGDEYPRYVQTPSRRDGLSLPIMENFRHEMYRVVCPNGRGIVLVRDRIFEKIRKRDANHIST